MPPVSAGATAIEPAMHSLQLYFCAGSHLAAREVRPTQVFSVLVARGVRHLSPPRNTVSHSLFYSGSMGDLAIRLETELAPNAILIVMPRNMHGIPMLMHLHGRLRRLVEATDPHRWCNAGSSAQRVWRRLLAGARWLAAAVLTVALTPRLASRLRDYDQNLLAVLDVARRRQSPLVVLTTPIPLPIRHFPGALHQRAFAGLLRRHACSNVMVVDLFRELSGAGSSAYLQREDPLHLTAEGHRRVAALILGALKPHLATASERRSLRPGATEADVGIRTTPGCTRPSMNGVARSGLLEAPLRHLHGMGRSDS
jgi:hypothetical protein